MKTKIWAIALMIITTFLTSTAQILWKTASKSLSLDILAIITNYYLIGGIILYFLGAALMITAFKGGELSVLYPIIATSYIWVGILSSIIFKENLSPIRWLGISSIVFGVIFIGIGSPKKGAA